MPVIETVIVAFVMIFGGGQLEQWLDNENEKMNVVRTQPQRFTSVGSKI